MIKSRTITEDPDISCATCQHLRYSAPAYCCNIDGEQVPDPELITMTTCDCRKEVRKHGELQFGSEAG